MTPGWQCPIGRIRMATTCSCIPTKPGCLVPSICSSNMGTGCWAPWLAWWRLGSCILAYRQRVNGSWVKWPIAVTLLIAVIVARGYWEGCEWFWVTAHWQWFTGVLAPLSSRRLHGNDGCNYRAASGGRRQGAAAIEAPWIGSVDKDAPDRCWRYCWLGSATLQLVMGAQLRHVQADLPLPADSLMTVAMPCS